MATIKSVTRKDKTTGAIRAVVQYVKVGTMIEHTVKPIAKALKLDCLDEQAQLKPQSPCAKRRDWLDGKELT